MEVIPPTPLPAATVVPESQPTPQAEPPATAEKVFDPENPDWELRYHQLYELHAERFVPPAPGQNVRVKMVSGNEQSGRLEELTDRETSLKIGAGTVTFSMEMLDPDSAAEFFKAAYARQQALAQGRKEYQRWERRQQAAQQRQERASAGTPHNPASMPGENGVDVPDAGSGRGGPPKNEGANGRVTQVEQYIRDNAAVPQSLKVKAWGPVQPHGNGYKVRVQYTLESADGFGLSNEDMMFFMHASGRVYRKAAIH